MHQFYMDTNVFISYLKYDDPYHSDAAAIVANLAKNEIRAETSVLTVLEVAAVAGRLFEHNIGRNMQEKKIFIVKALQTLLELKINFIHIGGDTAFALGNIHIPMPSIFTDSIMVCMQAGLRTLDIMHLTAARHAKQMNSDLGAFVTGDRGIIDKRHELSKLIGIPLLSPSEYVKTLGLPRK